MQQINNTNNNNNTNNTIFEYVGGVRKSPLDIRDWNYKSFIPSDLNIPDEFDLRDYLPNVRNQGSRGTCVAFASCAMKEYQERLDSGYKDYFSPEFIYYFRENKPDEGMYLRDVMKILQQKGIVTEGYCPYESKDNLFTPNDFLLECALKFTINNYAQIYTIDDVKAALVKSGVCIIAFPVYKNRPELWRKQQTNEQPIGGHCMAIVGYNKDGFIIRNSWGSNWNGNGHIIYPYSEFGAHWEIWSSVDLKGSPKPPEPSCFEKIKRKCIII